MCFADVHVYIFPSLSILIEAISVQLAVEVFASISYISNHGDETCHELKNFKSVAIAFPAAIRDVRDTIHAPCAPRCGIGA